MKNETLLTKGFRLITTKKQDAAHFAIHFIAPPCPKGRCWVAGSILGHSFNALVFPEHALYPSYELGKSRISKLNIWRQTEEQEELLANFDRGWDIRPTTETAAAIVDILAFQLARRIFPWSRFYAIGRRTDRLGRLFRANSLRFWEYFLGRFPKRRFLFGVGTRRTKSGGA